MLNYFPRDVLPRDIERKTQNGIVGYLHEGKLIPCFISAIMREKDTNAPPFFPEKSPCPKQHFLEGADDFLFQLITKLSLSRISEFKKRPLPTFYVRVTDPNIMTKWPKLGYRLTGNSFMHFSREVPGNNAWNIVPTLANMLISDNNNRLIPYTSVTSQMLWQLYNPTFWKISLATSKMKRTKTFPGIPFNHNLAILRKYNTESLKLVLRGIEIGEVDGKTIFLYSKYKICSQYLLELGFTMGSLIDYPKNAKEEVPRGYSIPELNQHIFNAENVPIEAFHPNIITTREDG